jgi:hypothetical protein
MFGMNDNNSQPAGNDSSAGPLPGGSPQPNPFIETPLKPLSSPPTPMVTPDPILPTLPPQPPLPEIHPLPAKPASSAVPPGGQGDLLGLKAQALGSLQPLVGHLDQTPEEKFKTTMMLIQATDNAELVKEAYEAANKISDEKARAQALLDVVNEINYFTQHNGDTEDKPAQV